MLRKKTIFKVFIFMTNLLLLSNVSLGQEPITVTAADAPHTLGTTFEMASDTSVSVNLGSAGANQSWDFSAFTPTKIETWEVISPEGTPFAAYLPNANLVYKVTQTGSDTIAYNYVSLTDTNLTELGRGKIVGSDTLEYFYAVEATPKILFPVKYGDPSWYSVLKILAKIKFAGSLVQGAALDSTYNIIDGWGTVVTPMGTFPCLRVKQEHRRYMYLGWQWTWPFDYESHINYYWITNDYGIIVLVESKDKETNPNYSEAARVTIMHSYVEASVEDDLATGIPEEHSLSQNYPNPFNPTTTIDYKIAKPSQVSLKVYNIQGQEVTTLVDAYLDPGSYQATWEVKDAASGVYFYELRAGDFVQRKKCLLLR